MQQPIDVGFGIDVVEADAFNYSADVLIVKDWRGAGGLDAALIKRIRTDLGNDLPILDTGEYHFVQSNPVTVAPYSLIIGPTARRQQTYKDFRELAFDMLRYLAIAAPDAEHVMTNVQGINRGFDEEEALRAMLLGFNDAYEAGEYPKSLRHITFVERASHRAALLQESLDDMLPSTTLVENVSQASQDIANVLQGQESFSDSAQGREADDSDPHIFVAMPFSEAYDDQYYLAIYPAVKNLNHLCIRLDQDDSAFTGNIIDEIKSRIKSAKMVIALLDSANPNVFLEVGYAWGCDVPTMLLIHEDEAGEVPFDVRGERLIVYKHIYKLKQELSKLLKTLV